MALVIGRVAVQNVFGGESVEARVEDESYTAMLCSASYQAGHVFNPHIVTSLVRSFEEEEVDMLAAVTFLADVQRNVAEAVAAT